MACTEAPNHNKRLKGKNLKIKVKKVLHRGYEGQNLKKKVKKVLHRGYEGQNLKKKSKKRCFIRPIKDK